MVVESAESSEDDVFPYPSALGGTTQISRNHAYLRCLTLIIVEILFVISESAFILG